MQYRDKIYKIDISDYLCTLIILASPPLGFRQDLQNDYIFSDNFIEISQVIQTL